LFPAFPYQSPRGISYVFVNGMLTVRDGRYNQALAGKVLRKGARWQVDHRPFCMGTEETPPDIS